MFLKCPRVLVDIPQWPKDSATRVIERYRHIFQKSYYVEYQ